MRFKIYLIAFLSLFLLVSCSELVSWIDSKPDRHAYYNNIVKFDLESYRVMISSNYRIDPFADGDNVIGEPYTDLNLNGVYDRGIDIFIKSTGADNMDLNHNSKYDGPDARWTPGLAYEDLNENGKYDFPSNRYELGEPFVDINRNGSRDSDTYYDRPYGNYSGFMTKCFMVDSVVGELKYEFFRFNKAWVLVSQKSNDRYFPFSYDSYIPKVSLMRFVEREDGLYYNGGNALTVKIIDRSGLAQMDSRVEVEHVVSHNANDQWTARKIVHIDSAITIAGYKHEHVIVITFSEFVSRDGILQFEKPLKFFFSEAKGFLGADIFGDSYFLREDSFKYLPVVITGFTNTIYE